MGFTELLLISLLTVGATTGAQMVTSDGDQVTIVYQATLDGRTVTVHERVDKSDLSTAASGRTAASAAVSGWDSDSAS